MTCPSVRFLSFARAYFVEEFGSTNIVHVPDDQGLLQVGMVVDKTEDGVLVDFFCKGQAFHLVEYGKLLECQWQQDFWPHTQKSDKIQVLLRLSNDRPFAWHCAESVDIDMSSHYRREMVQVTLKLEGAEMREIVHKSQIRNVPIGTKNGTVDKDYFRTGLSYLPADYATLNESAPLWKMCYRDLQRSDWTQAVRIRSGNVEYLRRHSEQGQVDMKASLDWMAKRMESCVEKGLIWSGKFFARSVFDVLPDDGSASVPFRCLPIDVLVEIFQHLESVDRIRLRRVAPHWDGILSAETLFKDVWVSLKYRYDCPFKWSIWDSLHGVVVALTRLVTRTTNWVIILGSKDSLQPSIQDQHIEQPMRLIADVARYFSMSLAGKLNFVICEFLWSPGDAFSVPEGVEEMVGYCTKCAPVCDTLVLKDCTFEDRAHDDVIFQISIGTIKVASPTLHVDLWEMLDRNVPETNLQEISQWLAQDVSTGEVAYFLEEFQTPDPRITPQSTFYRGEDLTNVEKGKLDVRRLTRLTLWMLSAEMAKKTARGVKRSLDESSENNELTD